MAADTTSDTEDGDNSVDKCYAHVNNGEEDNNNPQREIQKDKSHKDGNQTNCEKARVIKYQGQLTCDFCQTKLSYRSCLLKHMFRKHGFGHRNIKKKSKKENMQQSESTKCGICSEYFLGIAKLRVHKLDEHYVCDICNVRHPSLEALHQHQRTHSGFDVQTCPICNREYLQGKSLENHLSINHFSTTAPSDSNKATNNLTDKTQSSKEIPLKIRCPYCQLCFTEQKECREHVQTHQTKETIECKTCSSQFDVKETYLKHLFVHSKTENIQCDVCKNFFSIDKTKWHSECSKRIFICDYCGKAYPTQYYVIQHRKTHSNIKAFKCTICHMTFKTSKTLGEHRNIHFPKSFTCEFCTMTFRSYKNVKRHIDSKHFTVDQSLKLFCHVCHREFRSKRALSSHMAHHKPKIIPCSFCSRLFRNHTQVKIHERTHTGERPHVCQICNKAFVTEGTLIAHQLVHSNMKPHKCKICEKSFKTKTHLSYHMHIHTGERPYVCDVCGKGFTNQTHRKTHMRIHTGEQPYACSYCQVAYPTNAQLQRHLLTHQT